MKSRISLRKKNQTQKPETVGNVVDTPFPLIRDYKKAMRSAVQELSDTFEKEIFRFYREPLAQEYFSEDANIATQLNKLIEYLKKSTIARFFSRAFKGAETMVFRSRRETRALIRTIFKDFEIDPPDLPKGMQEVIRASLEENASLIRNIYSNYVDRIAGDLMRTITTGESNFQRLKEIVEKCRDVALHRAENVAMDQTRKAFQTLSRERLKAAGVQKGIWVHTGGTVHPRKEHQEFSGKEFLLKEGAPIGHFDGRTDAPTWPGFQPFCRCIYKPVLDWGLKKQPKQ